MKAFRLCRAFSQGKDFYGLLRVSEQADAKEIKEAYHLLAKKHHPDSPEGNEELFKQISEAYEVLKNKEKRTEYDGKVFKQMAKKKEKDLPNTHSSEKNHQRYQNVFTSGSWSGGGFSSQKAQKSPESHDFQPSDLILRMGVYSLTSACAVFLLYISYLLLSPLPENSKNPEKILRPLGLTTRKPERSAAKN